MEFGNEVTGGGRCCDRLKGVERERHREREREMNKKFRGERGRDI